MNTTIVEIKLSLEEKLRTNPIVSSMIERGEDCLDFMALYNMIKVGKRQDNILTFFI